MTTGKKVLIGCLSASALFILGIIGIVAIAMFATSGINDVANNQLKAIRSGDVAKAYSYTSKDFQAATTLDDFKTFVEQNPSLKNNDSSSFLNRSIENNEGTLEGSLKAKDGGVTPVTYKFVKEDDEWRILSIELKQAGAEVQEQENKEVAPGTTAEQPAEAKETSIFDVRISDKANENGVVDTTVQTYKPETNEILVSAYVEAAKKDMTVSALLTYVATGDTVGPAENQMSEDGDVISNFSFTKPTKGWPTGDYKVTIKTSTGLSKDVSFSVK